MRRFILRRKGRGAHLAGDDEVKYLIPWSSSETGNGSAGLEILPIFMDLISSLPCSLEPEGEPNSERVESSQQNKILFLKNQF
jgi:hypothetical protein